MVVVRRAMRQDLRRLAACPGETAARDAPPARVRAIGRYTAALPAGTLGELCASVGALREMLDEHIADEEEQILLVMRRGLGLPPPEEVTTHSASGRA
jgi:hypothetical protein